ncbi:hypothetical protein K502DRAFT_73065 [Neoconidiobolus thromboides FSU 785]|nr:hypothetical protein K502DRAFT_73065 [Neoconidiobolus thromboides FSU 785]
MKFINIIAIIAITGVSTLDLSDITSLYNKAREFKSLSQSLRHHGSVGSSSGSYGGGNSGSYGGDHDHSGSHGGNSGSYGGDHDHSGSHGGSSGSYGGNSNYGGSYGGSNSGSYGGGVNYGSGSSSSSYGSGNGQSETFGTRYDALINSLNGKGNYDGDYNGDNSGSYGSKGRYSSFISDPNLAARNYHKNWSSCREGTMFCDYNSGGFYTCAQGRYVLRQCGPGTRCQQQAQDNVFCNYA